MSTEAPEYPDKIDGAVLKVAGVVVIGAIMSILDITVVNVALPTFQRVFADGGGELDYSLVAWTVTGYTLALATVIPMTGWAADRFGTKRLYLTAIALFTIGSTLCATAWDINSLIAFRVLQGLGGGMLMPLGMTIMTQGRRPAPHGSPDGDPRHPDDARPHRRPHPRWLAHRHRVVALDLPDQPAARHHRARLLVRGPAQGPPGSVGVVRLPRHAAAVAGARAVPVRRLLASGRGRRLHRASGVALGPRRRRADGDVRVPLVPAGAPAARPAAVQGPQPDGLDHHDVHVRRRVLRWPAAGAHVLPADPWGNHPERRPAGRSPGHRRHAHDADRRFARRSRADRAHRPGRTAPDRRRHVPDDPDRREHVLRGHHRRRCSSWAWAWAAR